MLKLFNPTAWAAVAAGTLLIAGCGGSSDAPTTNLRVVHASADAPAVDVYVRNDKVLSNVPFKQASGFLRVNNGDARIQVNPTGSSTSVIDATVPLPADRDITVLAVNNVAAIEPLVVVDDGAAPSGGQVKLRVVHAAPAVPAVNIFVTGPNDALPATPTIPALAFKAAAPASSQAALQVPGGDYRIRATVATDTTNAIAFDSGKVTLPANADLLIVAVPAAGSASPISLAVAPKGGAAFEIRDQRAQVRVGHLAPNVPAVDAFLRDPAAANSAANLAVGGAVFTNVTSFLKVAPGSYRASVALAGQTTEVVGLDATLAAGSAVSVFATGLLAGTGTAALQLRAYPDDLALPAAGKAKLRVIHLSPDAPAVDVVVLAANGSIAARLVTNLAFPQATASYLSLDPGSYTAAVVPTGASTPVLPTAAGVPLVLAAGKVVTVLAIGCLAPNTGACTNAATNGAFALKALVD